ncbi:MAG: cation:proton antiporter [Candidatus Omnitrophica bacterium]|nr:cation:proton antiporter [Candidatus Omnitrophota bacterium]
MEVLLLVGVSVFFGTLGGKVFQKLKIPQVTGYIVVGLFLGQTGIKILSLDLIEQMTPLVNLALGIIGFMIGSELKMEIFRNRGRSMYSILFCEGLMTFVLVSGAITLLTRNFSLGILFGALASATAPAATVDVLWEYKTRGPLTTTLLAIVALDDVLALVLYAFAGLLAKSFLLHEQFSLAHVFWKASLEIGIGTLIGVVSGFILYWLIHFIQDKERVLPFSLGVIALTVGLATHFKIDLILACLLAGITLTNIAPVESKEIFNAIKRFSVPLYIFFFVLVGARLNIAVVFGAGLVVLAMTYLVSRTVGKVAGSFIGGLLGKAPKSVTRYLGLGLFSQAGVAIGLAISIFHNLSHIGPEAAQVGLTVVNVIVATTFVVQLIGPPCVRLAVEKAGEMWKNITEEDIIESYKVVDLIEKNVPVIREDADLNEMVELVKESESCDFCVVDKNDHLLGSISIGDLRDVLLDQGTGLRQLVLAKDIAVPSTRVIAASRPLKEAIDILRRKDLDFLPVVKDEKSRKLAGLIHYRCVMKGVDRELLARRGQ